MDFQLGNSLKGRLLVRFGALILIFVACVAVTFIILNRTIESNDEINTVYTPSVRKVQDTKLLITRANALISNWIFVASDNNNVDKKKLLELMNGEYPQTIKRLKNLSEKWSKADKQKLDSVITNTDKLFEEYKSAQ